MLMRSTANVLTVIGALGSVVLAAAALLVVVTGFFGPFDESPLQSGEELIISPVLAILALVAALSAWFRKEQRGTLQRRALKFAIGVLLLSAAYTGLFVLSLAFCHEGVC
jgi:hypothetical protein